jgi:hypothetical protein
MLNHHEGRPDGSSAIDALKWMRGRVSGTNQVLFRGQTRIHPTILPSLLRPNMSDEDRRQWWAVLCQFVRSRDGVTGYHIPSPHDAVAIVQHYLIRSPVLDVTGTPEIALYFATRDLSSNEMRVVYAADAAELEAAGLCVTDHAFLALPLEDGGRKHRWLRQDGFTVGPSKWNDLDEARKLDFAHLPGVERCTFTMRPGEQNLVAGLGDLETVEGDPLAAGVRGVFETLARGLGCLEAVRRLMPASGTIDAHGQLIIEIELLIQSARSVGLPKDDITSIENLLRSAVGGIWDTSFEASLAYFTRKVKGESASRPD